ncbi:hypothetical protein EVAR_91018_1 [Eumeta japonica]|uniref:Uncharacterized protein n=1 Tax=Eumeta variegata TaxID=151549 RepID=A0A4C1SMM2_EUMVA|nr:hypothetical protein EVAR_91018_1 [Eumeta japonica]
MSRSEVEITIRFESLYRRVPIKDEGRRYIPYRTHESPADVVATPVLRFNLVNFQFYKSFGAIVTLSIDGHDNVPSSTARVARLT